MTDIHDSPNITSSRPSASKMNSKPPKDSVHPVYLLNILSIVHKNLEHYADWTELTIHSSPSLPRPLISGIPPEQIHIDPDADPLETEMKLAKNVATGESEIDREWVLPVDIREKWSIRKWAEVFDSITAEPPVLSGEQGQGNGGWVEDKSQGGGGIKRKKRLVMGIVSGDSTVVHYIIHDGIVKPRQN